MLLDLFFIVRSNIIICVHYDIVHSVSENKLIDILSQNDL